MTTQLDVDAVLSAVEPCPYIPLGAEGHSTCIHTKGLCDGSGSVRRFPGLWMECPGCKVILGEKMCQVIFPDHIEGWECPCKGTGWVYAPILELALEELGARFYAPEHTIRVGHSRYGYWWVNVESHSEQGLTDTIVSEEGDTLLEAMLAALAAESGV